MKLVDFDGDGIKELLVGFISDSARVGILDLVTQTWRWQSPGFNGIIHTVAAGDRDADGYVDIVCGGQRSDSTLGYVEVFDGPSFGFGGSASGFDQIVTTANISARYTDSLPEVFVGTYLYRESCSPEYPYLCIYETGGGCYLLDGQSLETTYDMRICYSAIERMLVMNVDGDAYRELLLGWNSYLRYESSSPGDFVMSRCGVGVFFSASDYVRFYLYSEMEQGSGVTTCFDAMAAGKLNEGKEILIVGSGRKTIWSGNKVKLACWDATNRELLWSEEWAWSGRNFITDLSFCCLNTIPQNVVVAVYADGLVELRSAVNGSVLAASPQNHRIYHMELGDVDGDYLAEISTASTDSLYIYKSPSIIDAYYIPVVLDIPGQIIAEGDTFAVINLDDYVFDVNDANSDLIWTYSGNTKLTVDIANRIATIILPDKDWNGSETITFRATDPVGLYDEDTATFSVSAVNDTPVVSGIPDQTISEGDSFATINLDDYISDVDNAESQIAWTSSGNIELKVKISSRVATITAPTKDWSGSETITFRATDPGCLYDEDAATFSVSAVNDAPVVSDIPDQTIVEGDTVAIINLDDYVFDIESPDNEMNWSFSGNAVFTVDIDSRIATITTTKMDWYGSEIITFRAADPDGLYDEDEATFTRVPGNFSLMQNYPNPFNPGTTIRFNIPFPCEVSISIYNIKGERVRVLKQSYPIGTHTLTWDGKNSTGQDVASGIYFYRLAARDYQDTKKMVLIR